MRSCRSALRPIVLVERAWNGRPEMVKAQYTKVRWICGAVLEYHPEGLQGGKPGRPLSKAKYL
jgi:hypothetical protein